MNGQIRNPHRAIPPFKAVGEILVAKVLAMIHGLTESHKRRSRYWRGFVMVVAFRLSERVSKDGGVEYGFESSECEI